MYFDGYLLFNTYTQYDLFSDGTLWDMEVLSASSDMSHEEYGEVHFGGNVHLGEGVNTDGAATFFSSLQGSFLVESAEENWLKSGFSPLLNLYAVRNDTQWGTTRGVLINGSLPYDGEYIRALSFTNTLIFNEISGYPCATEPQGLISIRTKEGIWLDVLFDVDGSWNLTGECDGCGIAHTSLGEMIEVCLDVSALLDWEEKPW